MVDTSSKEDKEDKEDKIYTIQHYLTNGGDKYYYILSNLIQTYKVEHSTNINGIFLNLSTLEEHIINDIYFRFINAQTVLPSITDEEPHVQTISKPSSILFVKDKLTMDKFDNYLLQQSRINIGI